MIQIFFFKMPFIHHDFKKKSILCFFLKFLFLVSWKPVISFCREYVTIDVCPQNLSFVLKQNVFVKKSSLQARIYRWFCIIFMLSSANTNKKTTIKIQHINMKEKQNMIWCVDFSSPARVIIYIKRYSSSIKVI